MATPLTYLKVHRGSGVIDVPIYKPTDFPTSPLRIMTSKGVGVFNLNYPPQGVRYIRDWLTGSEDWPTEVIWAEIMAIDQNGTNVALFKPYSFSPGETIIDAPHVNDGIVSYGENNGAGILGTTPGQMYYAQIDLQSVINLKEIVVWHYYDGRTFLKNRLEVSTDGVNWVAIFDTTIHGTYPETIGGKKHSLSGVQSPLQIMTNNGVRTIDINVNDNRLVTDGLVAYFNSKKGVSGGTWANIAPSNKGVYNASVTGASAQDRGMAFDISSHVDINLPMAVNSSPYTLELRVQGDNLYDTPSIIADDVQHYTMYLGGNGTVFLVRVGTLEGSVPIPGGLANSSEKYLAFTYNPTSGSGRFYMNGAFIGDFPYPVNQPFSLDGAIRLGGSYEPTQQNWHYTGILDNFRFYNRVLTDTEIANNYRVGREIGLPPDDNNNDNGQLATIALEDFYISPTYVTVVENTSEYIQISASRVNGIFIPIRHLKPNVTHTVFIEVQMVIKGNLGAIQFHIWNKTKNVRHATNFITAYSTVGPSIVLNGPFTTDANATSDEYCLEIAVAGAAVSTVKIFKSNLVITEY